VGEAAAIRESACTVVPSWGAASQPYGASPVGIRTCRRNDLVYLAAVQMFFRSADEIEAFEDRLSSVRCSTCKVAGNMIRHGFVRWIHSPLENGIRAWRVRCKNSPLRNGCGKTFSLRLGETIPRHLLTRNNSTPSCRLFALAAPLRRHGRRPPSVCRWIRPIVYIVDCANARASCAPSCVHALHRQRPTRERPSSRSLPT
jgi:hypothetical protein